MVIQRQLRSDVVVPGSNKLIIYSMLQKTRVRTKDPSRFTAFEFRYFMKFKKISKQQQLLICVENTPPICSCGVEPSFYMQLLQKYLNLQRYNNDVQKRLLVDNSLHKIDFFIHYLALYEKRNTQKIQQLISTQNSK
ncbi:Hypothetical_protein [Hexamita inflata]|uniref:Hypothetical_protein n=1 Tax=Hexamita inflata TaxID=28002 RepID=A0AA86QQM9_9EUKA|nr:Hypothetical protein HINF_LOCUS51769 [Hexamita inflata]